MIFNLMITLVVKRKKNAIFEYYSMKINIILPPANGTADEIRAMYRLSNGLAERRHRITIYHAMQLSGFERIKARLFQHILRQKRRLNSKMIKLHENITVLEVIDISNDLINDATFALFTGYAIANDVFLLGPSKGIKINFVLKPEWLDLEVSEKVFESIRMPIVQVVADLNLKDEVVKHFGGEPEVISINADGADDQISNIDGAVKDLEGLFNSKLTYLQRLQTIDFHDAS